MFTDVGYERTTYRRSASRLTIAAHLFGLLAFILMLVWLVHYREGIEYDSSNPNRVFNAHPFFMFCGFIFLAGEAMMGYKTVKAEHSVQKFFHAILHLTALCLGVTGICAVFKYHDMVNVEDMYSLHSWIGLTTFVLFCLQWLLGLSAFLFPGSSTITRAKMLPWHVCGGRALFYMAICAALTGLIEKFTYMGIQHNREARLINFTGLSILLYGIFVDLSVALARYV
ncbi:probable transmembrane ascorbate ferrireductase 3 isoform X1 [Mangifera indica]|uniref:probable transmembrane ascorbate ferrireductase 3 isoform X1 n=1 Tax=Mangifera indica TaxID=29780 RepID=UPI001CF9703D|nr:probable transmembrane ascorbate ferrireductase 3 isoform X1 [Mangifera indica]